MFYCRCSSFSPRIRHTRLFLEYSLDREEIDRIMSRIEDIGEMLKQTTLGKNDIKKESAVHGYLTSTVTYDAKAPNCYTMVGALIDRHAVCQGISLAACYLLNSVGVDAGVICGTVNGENEGHAWNVVNIAGHNYHVDVTFDHGSYRFFNLSDQALRGQRTWDPRIKCSGKKSYRPF